LVAAVVEVLVVLVQTGLLLLAVLVVQQLQVR
jgi:hypothetical protein